MSIINTSKPSSSIVNSTRINIGEVWATDLNQWQNESRTWNATASIITNAIRVLSSMTNTARPA